MANIVSNWRWWGKWLIALAVLMAVVAQCEGQQQQQQQQRRRPLRDGRRQRRHRSDKAKLIQHYLKKNGRLEGMIRLVDGIHDNEGINFPSSLDCCFMSD